MIEQAILGQLTDADTPTMKRYFADMMKSGRPLRLYRSLAEAAKAKGFVEGEHFLIIEPIPRTR